MLRSRFAIAAGHWASGSKPGECETCAWPESKPSVTELSPVELDALSARLGADPEPFARGWRAAEAVSAKPVELHPALLEREEEDLDGFTPHPDDETE